MPPKKKREGLKPDVQEAVVERGILGREQRLGSLQVQGERPDERCQRHITSSQLLDQNFGSRFQLVVAGRFADSLCSP